jgi:membrane associated rhomboid family serine protease
MRSLHVDPIATYVLIGINVLMFLGSGGGGGVLTGGGSGSTVFNDFALSQYGVGVEHNYWQLITAGFLHSGILHIGFNMYILYWLGTMLEPSLGHARFLALYFASLLAGSFGALLLSPNAVTVGASGAVFGLMGAAFVLQRARGIDPMQSGIGPIILINLVLGFVIPNVSIGGHLGGLAGGVLCAFAMERVSGGQRGVALSVAACVLIGIVAAVAGVAVSAPPSAG